MSSREQFDYCNGHEQGGNWPDQIPPELRCKPGKNLCLLTNTFQQFLCSNFVRIGEQETLGREPTGTPKATLTCAPSIKRHS